MAATTPIITEFLAINDSDIQDEDGNRSDWIELYNPTASDVNLEGYFLTEAMQPTQAELHVRPDRGVKYDTVAQVLALAQRSGIERIGFTGQEQLLD